MTSTHPAPPPTADLRRLLDAELSRPSRLGYAALLLASTAMTIAIASLWLTEPMLVRRAQLAFAVMTAIGLSWMVFAGWVLTSRRVLYGRDSLVAARMAVTFTTVFAAGALAVGYTTGAAAGYAAAAMGVVLIAFAVSMLVRAQREVARLAGRREALERELGRTAQ